MVTLVPYHTLLHLDIRMQVLSVQADDDHTLRILFWMASLLIDNVEPRQQDVQVGVVVALVLHELKRLIEFTY